MIKAFVILSLITTLCGCHTPYQKTSLLGGFSESQLQPNVFSVHFQGNAYTSRERCIDYTLLRCAELTLENGFKYFVIVDSSQDSKTMMYNTGGHSKTYAKTNIFGKTTFNTYNYGSMSIPMKKLHSTYTIMCHKEKPIDAPMAFDAAFLANSLRQKYENEQNTMNNTSNSGDAASDSTQYNSN